MTLTKLQTDDVGVFCSPLSEEYFLAARHFELGRRELVQLSERAIGSVFSGSDEQVRLKAIYSQWGDKNM